MREEQGGSGLMRIGFAPVADGVNIPKGTFYSEPGGVSSEVPMMLCTTFHEWGMARTNPEMEKITAEDAIDVITSYSIHYTKLYEHRPAGGHG